MHYTGKYMPAVKLGGFCRWSSSVCRNVARATGLALHHATDSPAERPLKASVTLLQHSERNTKLQRSEPHTLLRSERHIPQHTRGPFVIDFALQC